MDEDDRMVDPKEFKDVTGRWRTRSLFYETNDLESKYPSIFTLKDQTHKGRPSLYQAYMEANDPTEYRLAIEIFGSVACWQNLCHCEWFKPYVTRWRKELQNKIRSEAIMTARLGAAGSANATQVNAAKWLATLEFEGNKIASAGQQKAGPGRPKKSKDPTAELGAALLEIEDVEKDYLRLVKETK